MRAENLLHPKEVADKVPAAKPFKLNDGGGLFCLVQPNGAKLWRYRYEVAGKEKLLAIGSLADVSLAQARKVRDNARQVVRAGGDPSADKKAAKLARRIEAGKVDSPAPAADTFAHFAAQAMQLARAPGKFEQGTLDRWERELERYAVAHFGPRPIAEIKRSDVLEYLRGYERQGKISTMHGVRRKLAFVFELAMDAELIEANPAAIATGRLTAETANTEHHPAIIDPKRFGEMLRAFDGYGGQPATIACLKLSALCFVRPSEIRKGRWAEIDWDAALWTIPAERMKKVGGKRYAHLVPLSRQALAILRDLFALTGSGELIFPGLRRKGRAAEGLPPISENTINNALRGMDIGADEMTGHGFRASANTMALEMKNWPRWISEPAKVVDRQLAHVEKDQSKKPYDRAQFIEARTWLMQAWADECDRMRAGGKVVRLARSAVA